VHHEPSGGAEYQPLQDASSMNTVERKVLPWHLCLLTLLLGLVVIIVSCTAVKSPNQQANQKLTFSDAAVCFLGLTPHHPFLLTFLLILAFLCYLMYKFGPQLLGLCFKGFIETVDKYLLGTDVHVQRMELSLIYGELHIAGVVVDNPPKFPVGPCIQLATCMQKFDVWTYIGSGGRYARFPHVVLDGLQIHLHKRKVEEGALAYNIEVVLDNLDHAVDLNEMLKRGPEKVFIHHLEIRNVTVPSHRTAEQAGHSWPTLVIPDIVFQDFDKETGLHLTTEVLKFLWKIILESSWHQAQHVLGSLGMPHTSTKSILGSSQAASASGAIQDMAQKTKEKLRDKGEHAREKIDRLVKQKFGVMPA